MTYQIRIRNKIINYNISGIKHGRKHTEIARRQLLLEIIEKNPMIQHTHVLKIVEHLDGMPKKTAEKILNSLQSAGLIKSTKYGNSPNAKRSYEIPLPSNVIKLDLQYNLGLLISKAQETFTLIEEKYSSFLKVKQNTILYNWMRFLHNIQSCVTVGQVESRTLELSKQRMDVDQLVKKTNRFLEKLDFNTKRFLFSLLMNDVIHSKHELKNYLEMENLQYFATLTKK